MRDYAQWAFADEEGEPELWFGEPVVDGDRAVVEYRAVLKLEGGEMTLVGVSVLRFDSAGLVAEHRDYWAIEEGRH